MAALNPSTITSTQNPSQIKRFKYIQCHQDGPIVHYVNINDNDILLSIPLRDISISDQSQFQEYLKDETHFKSIKHIMECNDQLLNKDNLSTISISVQLHQKQNNGDIMLVQGVVTIKFDSIMTGHHVANFIVALEQQLPDSKAKFDFNRVEDNTFIFSFENASINIDNIFVHIN